MDNEVCSLVFTAMAAALWRRLGRAKLTIWVLGLDRGLEPGGGPRCSHHHHLSSGGHQLSNSPALLLSIPELSKDVE